MKSILNRLTPKQAMWILLTAELMMGVSYIGIILLQSSNNVLCMILQYLYQLLHLLAVIGVTVLALRRADKSTVVGGIPTMLLLLGCLCIKDYFGNFYTFWLGQGYLMGDALILALPTTALSTLLAMTLILGITYALAYLFYLSSRPAAMRPTDPWNTRENHLLRAAVFTTCLLSLPSFVSLIINQFDFLINEVMWMPTGGEIATMVLDILLIPTFACGAYYLSYSLLAEVREDTSPLKRDSEESK